MIDRKGKLPTDPNWSGEGFLPPIADYESYGLALMVGLLAGTLNGAAMGRDVVDFNADNVTSANTGLAILVIDLAAFGGAEAFRASLDTLIRDIRGSERLPGVERVWLPGEQSHGTRIAYTEASVPLPVALVDDLVHLAARLGVVPTERPKFETTAV